MRLKRDKMSEKIDLKTKLAYGAGVSYAVVDQIFVQWVLYFYLPPESSELKRLLPPILISIALSFSRVIDVITDPLVGYISDKTETKWGRRIPFIAIGTFPLALTTIGFFFLPNTTQIWQFLYLALIGSLFFTFYTIVGGPYNSLIPELGKTKEEQLSLATWQSLFRLIFTAIAMILPGVLIKNIGQGDELLGIRGMVIVLCIISLIGGYITVFFVDEKRYSCATKVKINFKDSLNILKSNKSFIFYLLGLLMFFVGFNSIRSVINYYVEVIMGYGKVEITQASALLFVVAAIFFKPVEKMCIKIGYKKVMINSLILLALLSLSMLFIGRGISGKYGFLIFALLGVPISGAAFILPPAMLSEISRKISKESGVNIEGVCFGIQGFFLKMAFLVSVLVLPHLLTYGSSGNVGKDGIYLSVIFSFLSFLVGIYFYSKYEE